MQRFAHRFNQVHGNARAQRTHHPTTVLKHVSSPRDRHGCVGMLWLGVQFNRTERRCARRTDQRRRRRFVLQSVKKPFGVGEQLAAVLNVQHEIGRILHTVAPVAPIRWHPPLLRRLVVVLAEHVVRQVRIPRRIVRPPLVRNLVLDEAKALDQNLHRVGELMVVPRAEDRGEPNQLTVIGMPQRLRRVVVQSAEHQLISVDVARVVMVPEANSNLDPIKATGDVPFPLEGLNRRLDALGCDKSGGGKPSVQRRRRRR